MKKQPYLKLTWIFPGLLMIVSCKKNYLPQAGPNPMQPVNNGNNNDHPLITRYEYAPKLYTLFSYNSTGQITGITDVNDIARTDHTLTYKTDGKVTLKFVY